jgi:hypothetical protein
MLATLAVILFQKVAIIPPRSVVIAVNAKIILKAGRLRFLLSLYSHLHRASMIPPRHLLKKIEILRIMMITNPNG